jgi:HlyD family secretion protein
MNWKKKKDTPEAQTPEAAAAGKGPVPFLKKNWKWLVPVLCVAVAGGVFLLRPQQAKPASVDASYTEAAPERRDVTNTLSGTGTLNPANTYTVKSLVDGKVLTGTIEEGNIVEESNVLYTIDSSDASTNFEKAEIAMQQAQRSYDKVVDRQYVRAEVAGVVSSLKVTKGDEVTSGQEVAVIRDSSRMLLTLEFPAADAANFSVGQSAAVTLDGTFEQLNGTVTSVSGTDALSAGNLLTRTVTITVQNAGGLTTAQAATASINGVSSIGSATFAYQAERTLTAQAAGTVTSINVQEGSDVAKDDIILGLSGDDLTESIQSASESLRSAEISMQNLQDTMNNYTITAPISGTIIEKDAKVGDAVKTGDTLCIVYDLSYLEMSINVDELQISSISVGQKVQITADAVPDKTYVGTVTRVSMKGKSDGGTTTYPVTIRIDDTDGLRPGMNANAEIVVAEAKNALVVPNAAVVRGSYVLVTKDSPSAANADTAMEAPEGFVYVPVKTGVSNDDYTQIVSGIQEGDTIGYDPSSVSSDSYYDDGGYYMMPF